MAIRCTAVVAVSARMLINPLRTHSSRRSASMQVTTMRVIPVPTLSSKRRAKACWWTMTWMVVRLVCLWRSFLDIVEERIQTAIAMVSADHDRLFSLCEFGVFFLGHSEIFSHRELRMNWRREFISGPSAPATRAIIFKGGTQLLKIVEKIPNKDRGRRA